MKTDKDGRFRLTGFGRGRVVHLQIRGAGIEDNDVEVITRAGKVDGLRLESRTVYPLDAEFTVRPSKPIVGTVRDKKTGKPMSGIEVVSPNAHLELAASDHRRDGRYRIDGSGSRRVRGRRGRPPYFNSTKRDVADTPGLDPLVVDFDLERGVESRAG